MNTRRRNEEPTFKLQFPLAHVPALASRYRYEPDVDAIAIGAAAGERGHFTREELIAVCEWKTVRSKSLIRRNSAVEIEELTRLALSTPSERLRIWAPMALTGVRWATSSVLLHLAHSEPYPILDYRAMESLGIKEPAEPTFGFWEAYVREFRRLLDASKIDKRTLDRALWQWSKERSDS